MKRVIKKFGAVFGLAAAVCTSPSALAQWALNGDHSEVNFISIKNDSVAETHSFDSLVGYISKDGHAQLTIELFTVNTAIEIRDTRLQEMLFETAQFPSAAVSTKVDAALLNAIEGAVVTTDLEMTLDLHGHQQTLKVPVTLIGDTAGQIRVLSQQPVLVNAADFSLTAGIDALREVAGLNAISYAVPVTFHLVFDKES